MDTEIYYDLKNGRWADRNPSKCPCKGKGWFLSDFDVAFQCPMHGKSMSGKDVPNPYEENDQPFNMNTHILFVYRTAFRGFRYLARKNGFQGGNRAFTQACRAELVSHKPGSWVDAAEAISERLYADKADREAQARGFTCALEERFAEYAEEEQAERGSYH